MQDAYWCQEVDKHRSAGGDAFPTSADVRPRGGRRLSVADPRPRSVLSTRPGRGRDDHRVFRRSDPVRVDGQARTQLRVARHRLLHVPQGCQLHNRFDRDGERGAVHQPLVRPELLLEGYTCRRPKTHCDLCSEGNQARRGIDVRLQVSVRRDKNSVYVRLTSVPKIPKLRDATH